MKIEIRDVSKSFGKTLALDKVSTSFETGNIYGLLGRNAAGKSTLLNIITERLFADEGFITIDNEKLIGTTGQHNIHLMSESNMYQTDVKIKEIIKYAKAFYANWDEARFEHLICAFDLNPKKKWNKLSTGYRTIFKVIMALCSGRKFLFFDEPILGLDAHHRDLFYKEILDLFNTQPDICIVLSTHLIEEISKVVNKIIIIKDGKIIKDTDTETITSSGFEVRGSIEEVNKATMGCEVFSKKIVNETVSIKVYGKLNAADVEVTPLDLQETFIELTNKEAR